jgi:hypothetical protein
MDQPPFFMDLPYPRMIRNIFLECGAAFDLSLEDRRTCGLALERHFATSEKKREPQPWFMPTIFGGVTFTQTAPWVVMLAMGIYGYLAEGSPAPILLEPHTLGPGYHAICVPPTETFLLLSKNRTYLKLTEAFLRMDHKVDPRIWVDFYGLAPLKPEVRVVPLTLIPAEDLSGCIAGSILYSVERTSFLNPLKATFQPSDFEQFFMEGPSPDRLRSHRERLRDILESPLNILEANLNVGIDLIQRAFYVPSVPSAL